MVSKNNSSKNLSPVIYLPHGGGPMPILGETSHQALVKFFEKLPTVLGEPSAIVVISAHWEEECATLTCGLHPEIIYDYFGFPPEAYQIQYPVPGNPPLAQKLFDRLKADGFKVRQDRWRGFDHGLFIPLKLIYPHAQIPCIQLSLLRDLDPQRHIRLGKAIDWLRQENVIIFGSGMSFHNLRAFSSKQMDSQNKCAEFDRWLIDTCTRADLLKDEQERRLVQWENAPSARFCHPREEHLLPLHVCYGSACRETPVAKVVFNEEVLGKRVTGFLWA